MISKTAEQLVNDLLRDGNLRMWNRPHPLDYFNRNMKLEDDVLSLDFDVPGLSKDDFKVMVEDTTLVIDGKNESRSFFKKYNVSEDFDVSKTLANVENGILTITIPKTEAKKSKLIEIPVN